MEFSITEEQRSISELTQQILGERVTHETQKAVEASEERMDLALWRDLAESNLLGVALPEKYGGMDFGLFELLLLLEEAGRKVAPLPVFPTLVLGALPIAEFGSDEQKRALLPGVVSGELLLSAALTEVGSSDPARPRARARQEGDVWVLEGEKVCVPIAAKAARILVPAALEGEEGAVGVFLVDPASEGVRLAFEESTNLEPQYQVTFSMVRVPGSDVLGAPQDGAKILAWLMDRALLGLCALQLGVAQDALRQTAEYTSERRQFGRAIGSFQGVSLRMADAFIDVEALRSAFWLAAWKLGVGQEADKEIAAAKWWACMAGHRVAHTAQHLHGGTGADLDFPIHRYFLWAKQIGATLGGANAQLARIGEMLAHG